MNSSAAPASPTMPALPASLRAPSLRRRMACWLYEGTLMFGVVVLPKATPVPNTGTAEISRSPAMTGSSFT